MDTDARSSFRLSALCRLALGAILLTAPCGAATPPPTPESPAETETIPVSRSDDALAPEDLRDAIDEAVLEAMREQGAVGVAIGLVAEGRVAYTAGYGWADRERGEPCTTGTMFRWASISKPVTAVAAMQLAERGELDLDADVRDYVPEFPAKENENGDPQIVTPRRLLAHLGGVVHYSNGKVVRRLRSYEDEHPFADVVNALDTFADSPLVDEPGASFNYTTHGYILLSAVVQRAGGRPFHEQVRERIAGPLGMESLRPDYQWEAIAGRAKGYRRLGEVVIPSTNTDVSWKLGGGGYISTVDDLARFAEGLLGDGLVSPETKKTMWTRQRTDGGEELGYGLGFDVCERDGVRRIAHNGAQEKTRTRLVIEPESRVGFVAMTNSEYADVAEFTRAVERAFRKYTE